MHPTPLKPLPLRCGLDLYDAQATTLLAACRAGDAEALRHIRQHHPRLPGRADTNDRNPITAADIRQADVTPADAHCIVARWHGFADWGNLAAHAAAVGQEDSLLLAFESAVEAVVAGDESVLASLLREHPALVFARSTRAHRATLLHYVAANGVEGYRQRTPPNAVAVAKLFIEGGAEVDADLDDGSEGRRIYPERTGSTTLGLAATSFHPAAAGVQIALLELLLEAGASVDGLPGGLNPVIAALRNGRGDAAEFLAGRGARLDLESAAGTGRIYRVKSFFSPDGKLTSNATEKQMAFGFTWACEYGHKDVVDFLLRIGVSPLATPHGETGLHWASYGGHAKIVQTLLEWKVPLEIRDVRYRATPLKWALHGWGNPPPETRLARDYYGVVEQLVAAGARLKFPGDLDHGQITKLREDPRMSSLLGFREIPA